MSSNDNPKTPMTTEDAIRIQSHADKTGTNQGFKARAQSAAARNETFKSDAMSAADKNDNANQGDQQKK